MTIGDMTIGDMTIGDMTIGDMTIGDMTIGDMTIEDITEQGQEGDWNLSGMWKTFQNRGSGGRMVCLLRGCMYQPCCHAHWREAAG